MNYEYDVALSFAGEDRPYVEAMAHILEGNGFRVFYDRFNEVDLWGKDLYTHLDAVYRKKARYCVIFISQAYADKLWTNHERESAQARAFEQNQEYILPARFDDTEIPGVRPTTGYIDLRSKTPEAFAELVMAKLSKSDTAPTAPPVRRPRIPRTDFNPYEEGQTFIDTVANTLKQYGDQTSVSVSLFTRDGRTCVRVVAEGKPQYSLDMWVGGFSDSGLSFYGTRGELQSHSGNTMNAWGRMVWDRDREQVLLELSDMSLLSLYTGQEQRFTTAEFTNALWDQICDVLER